jgi:hypothetical protein
MNILTHVTANMEKNPKIHADLTQRVKTSLKNKDKVGILTFTDFKGYCINEQ